MSSVEAPSYISQEHWDEWVIGSGVAPHIVELNVRSLSDPHQIDKLLNRNNKKRWQHWEHGSGWRVAGVDEDTGEIIYSGCQFKPDTPVQRSENGQPKFKPDGSPDCQKYFSASDYPSEPLFLDTGIPDYWLDILTDISKPVIITEGPKKAGAGLTISIPTISIAGVTNGQKLGRFKERLKKFCSVGRTVYLCFDSDWLDNPVVQKSLDTLGKLVRAEGAVVKVILLPRETKAMDDFIVKHGEEKFKKLVEDAVTFEEWRKGLEQQFQQSGESTGKGKTPLADVIGQEIAESYRDKLAFNNENLTWMTYGTDFPGVWSPETQEYIESIISGILDAKGITYGSHSYVVNVTKKMRSLLIVRKWVEHSPKELLPFSNGVLEIATGKLLEHSPGYRFTWSLPRAHNPLAWNWNPIDQFLDEVSQGKEGMKKRLLCWMNAVLKGRSDLQRSFHAVGAGGTGKGTFMRLCISLIGTQNNCSSTLEDWNKNRFEPANGYRKRLISFPDEDKYSGGLGKFKSLTGGDWIRAEEKGKKGFEYQFDGMAMLASNYPIFAGDNSSGIARRMIVEHFNFQPAPLLRRNLEKEFEPCLDALTNYLLSIPDQEVTETLLGSSPESMEQNWEHRMRTDSIAAWLNECCVRDAESMTSIGADKDNKFQLFGNYYDYCQRTGGKAKGLREFSPSLIDLCQNILGWHEIERLKRSNGNFIKGLRLRSEDGDHGLPNPIDALSAPLVLPEVLPAVEGAIFHDGGLHGGSEAALSKNSGGCGGYPLAQKMEDELYLEAIELDLEPQEKEDSPSIPLPVNPGLGFSLALNPSVEDTSPSTSDQPQLELTAPESELVVGDAVTVNQDYSNYKGHRGKVVRVECSEGRNLYHVRWSGTAKSITYPRSQLKLLT